jgi:hypothetical protein
VIYHTFKKTFFDFCRESDIFMSDLREQLEKALALHLREEGKAGDYD